ncbi:MAG TPA: tetratricopeptide repeat protein [Candidatus Ozemobacteraceae bacterium]|nr:tetratricopeptide repeat protein [Candidatus Ozemobacteraceae bacterium]
MLVRVLVLLLCCIGVGNAWAEDLPGQILARAERHLAAEDLANARNLLDQAQALAPRDPRLLAFLNKWNRAREKKIAAHKRTAEFLIMSKQYYAAAQELTAATALDPADKEILEKLTQTRQALRLMEKHQENGIWVDPATGRAADPDLYDALSLLRRAREAKDRGDLPLALDLVDRVIAREKVNAEAAKLKEEILQITREFDLLADVEADTKSGRFFEALQRLDALLRSNPDSLDLRLRRANVLLRLEHYADSLRDFEKALELQATPTELLPSLVKIYSGLRRPVETLAVLHDPRLRPDREYLKIYIKSYVYAFPAATVGLVLSVLFLVTGIICFFRMLDALIERCPGNVVFKALKVLFLCSLGEPADQAVSMRAIAEKIDHPWFYYCTGLILITRDELDVAQKYLIPCLESHVFSARAYFFLGIIRARLGQKIADHDFEKAIVEGLKDRTEMWRPGFLKRLEESIVKISLEDSRKKAVFGDLAHTIIDGFAA